MFVSTSSNAPAILAVMDDWIEIYNRGSAAVDLSGVFCRMILKI
jgi:hypothetical protein